MCDFINYGRDYNDPAGVSVMVPGVHKYLRQTVRLTNKFVIYTGQSGVMAQLNFYYVGQSDASMFRA